MCDISWQGNRKLNSPIHYWTNLMRRWLNLLNTVSTFFLTRHFFYWLTRHFCLYNVCLFYLFLIKFIKNESWVKKKAKYNSVIGENNIISNKIKTPVHQGHQGKSYAILITESILKQSVYLPIEQSRMLSAVHPKVSWFKTNLSLESSTSAWSCNSRKLVLVLIITYLTIKFIKN